jgi:hypothetical protein
MREAKGYYGIIIEKYILECFYGVTTRPLNQKYDLNASLNTKSGCNVSIKSSKDHLVSCASISNFLSTENREMWYVHYKVIVSNKTISLTIYFLNSKLVDNLILEVNFNEIKLNELKIYFMSLNKKNITSFSRANYIKLSRDIDKNSLFTVNCKLSSTNQRIHISFSFLRYLKKVNPLLSPIYSNIILELN